MTKTITGWDQLSPTGRIAMRRWYRFFRNGRSRRHARELVKAQVWGVAGAVEQGWAK